VEDKPKHQELGSRLLVGNPGRHVKENLLSENEVAPRELQEEVVESCDHRPLRFRLNEGEVNLPGKRDGVSPGHPSKQLAVQKDKYGEH